MKTLLIGDIEPEALKKLEQNTELTKTSNEEFYANKYDVEAVVLRTFTQLQTEQLNNLPNLKSVVSCSVGLDNINLNELKERNIELIHTPGSNANSVAEHTLHLIIALLRQDPKTPVAELKNKTIGIVGLGHIGKIVARKLKGFEANVIAFDVIEQDPEVLKELNVQMKTFDEVTQQADILTIHVPLNKHTENLINSNVFANMKTNSFFINTSRAEVIEEASLIQHQSKFRGIALDVYSDNLKQQLTNHTILTDHIASQGEDSFRNMCLLPIEEFLKRID